MVAISFGPYDKVTIHLTMKHIGNLSVCDEHH
jgi:hypothetical protein